MKNDHADHANRPSKNYLTEAEKEILLQHYAERAALRQAEADLALIRAFQLGARLRAG